MKRNHILIVAAALAIVLVAAVALAVRLNARAAYAWGPAADEPSQAVPAFAPVSAAAATPLSTTFTYQGQLKKGGQPVTADCTMAFRLYDAAASGSQIGSAITPTVPVSNGLFTVGLDFGAGAFNGEARWLGVLVKCPPETGYTDLGRQPLAAAPYAQFAGTIYRRTVIVRPVGTATENGAALLAALADITDASASNPYLLKIEPGVYDLDVSTLQMKPYVDVEGSGEDVTLITSAAGGDKCAAPTVFGADDAELRFLTVENTATEVLWAIAICNNAVSPRLTHVTAVVEGDSEANTCAVLNQGGASPTMEDVIARASGGATNTGVSNETGSTTAMRNVIVSASGGNLSANTGLYNQANSPTLEDVTVSTSGGVTSTNIGVYNNSWASPTMRDMAITVAGGVASTNRGVYNNSYSSPTMMDVTASASAVVTGSNNCGVYNNDHSSPVMQTMVITASGGSLNYGVYNYISSPTMTNVSASASGGTNNYGVYNYNTSSPTMTNVSASASGGSGFICGVYNQDHSSPTMTNVSASASGGSDARGIYNDSISSPTMTNVSASASGGTNNYGVYNRNSSATIQNSTISAGGTSGVRQGIYNLATGGVYTVTVSGSQITGVDCTIYNDSEFTTRIGASQLSGGNIQNWGTITCIGAYDENYASPGYTTCP